MQASSYPYNTQYPRPPPPQTLNSSSGSPNNASGYNASGNVNLGNGPQRRPVQAKAAQTNGEGSRDSNALRASVLDAAIALGFGTNRTVENWMFNTVAEEDEEDEDEIRTSPGLTNGSSATSTPGPSTSTSPFPTPAYTQLHNRPFPNAETFTPPSSAPAAPPTPRSKNKLRKPRRGDDGYISDSTGPQPLKSAKSKRSKSKGPSGGGDSSDEGGGYFSDFARRRKSKKKSKDKDKDKEKSPREMPDDGEESDGGYLSEATKKKRGFFRLKSSKAHKASAAQPPPVPAMPPKLPSMATSTSSLSADIDWDRRESQDRARSTTPMAAVRPKESFDSFATMSTSTEDDDAWTAETPNTSMSGHGMGASSIGHGSKRSDGIGSSSHGHGSSNEHSASLGNDLGAGEFGAKKGVRFTPSTRFSGPALQAYAPEPVPPSPRVPALPASPSPAATAQRQQLLLSISPPYALAPKPTPSPTPSDFSFVSATEGVEPSTDYLVPSPSVTPVPPARSPDDVLTPQSGSDTISPQSTYIVPSPSAPNFQRDTSPLPSAGYIVPSPSTPTFSHAYQQPPQRGYQPYSRGRTPEPRPYTPDPDEYDDDLEPPRAPHLRVNVNASPTRSRSSHMDIPPPTPPPSGPLPDVPPGGEINGNGSSPSSGGGSGFRFPPPSPSVRDAPRGRSPLLPSYSYSASPTPPSAYAPSPVPPSSFGQPSVSSRPPSRAASPGPIMRGRESPFPVRPARPIIAVSAPAEDAYEPEPESPMKRGRPTAWTQSSSPQIQTQRSAGMAGQWSATKERERFLAATGGRDSPMAPGPFQNQHQNQNQNDGALLTPSSSIRRKPTLVNHRAELSLQALVYPEGSGEGRVTSAIVPESVTGFSDSDAGGVRESAFSDGLGGGEDEGGEGLDYLRDSGSSGSAFLNVGRTYDGEGVHARVGSTGAYAYAVNGRESTISMGDVLERTYGRESVYEDERRPESVYDDNEGRRESTYSLGGALRAGVRGSAYDDGAQDPRAMFGRESVYDDQDDASVYPPSQRTVDSYYFGNGSRPASIVDEQRSGDMRSKLMQRVGRGDDIVPPVPPLPRGANRAPAPF
ncbi:hypothetical protein PENSPDRAFT_752817 [Peniophora sp. CONT]|nr:hypothetical protein PENSPDRAFT_752817 [Peniophora sp. CONT]